METTTFLNLLGWFTLVLTVVCQFSGLTKYYVKMATLPVLMAAGSLVTLPRAALHYGDFRGNSLLFARVCRVFSYLLGIRWRVEVAEPVDKTRSYVVMCNHQSSLDTLAMMEIWHHLGATMMIAKREILYYGWFGLSMMLHGTVLLDRSSGGAGRDAINCAGRRAKEAGASLFVFPEGTRHRKRDLNFLPFRKGAFHVALDNHMDILPVVVSQYDFFDQEDGTFEPGEATVRILSPISVSDFDKSRLSELVSHTEKSMYDAFLEMSHHGELVRNR